MNKTGYDEGKGIEQCLRIDEISMLACDCVSYLSERLDW